MVSNADVSSAKSSSTKMSFKSIKKVFSTSSKKKSGSEKKDEDLMRNDNEARDVPDIAIDTPHSDEVANDEQHNPTDEVKGHSTTPTIVEEQSHDVEAEEAQPDTEISDVAKKESITDDNTPHHEDSETVSRKLASIGTAESFVEVEPKAETPAASTSLLSRFFCGGL